ncbi:hypothetical protein [Aureimonas ureilytica]|uniref:hypothetical protein n=1 Tax=Aureimonas ureilytica TaxID=401562 RepID=UPI00128FC550|nr:hypothetical protein [Aureimonas ureilytica]
MFKVIGAPAATAIVIESLRPELVVSVEAIVPTAEAVKPTSRVRRDTSKVSLPSFGAMVAIVSPAFKPVMDAMGRPAVAPAANEADAGPRPFPPPPG